MKFYTMPGACSMVGQVALEWANVAYDAVTMNAQSSKSPEFLAKNPMGSVPLLEEGDFLLTQNTAIMQYLSETYPAAHLFGSGDAKQQAHAHQWFGFINADIHSKFSILFSPARYASSEAAQAEIVTQVKALLRKQFEAINTHLQGRDYLADELTIADVYLMVVLNWAGFKDIDLSGLDQLPALLQRVSSNDAVQKVLAMQKH